MHVTARNASVRVLKLFLILIIAILVTACASSVNAPVVEKSRSIQSRPATHIVMAGDTLFSIAWRYGLRYEELAKHNRIGPPYLIRPSQVIRLDVIGALKPSGNAPQNLPHTDPRPAPSTSKPAAISRQEFKTPGGANKRTQLPAGQALTWGWPSKGAVLSRFQGNNGLNKGIDLSGKLGEPVLAAASGQVVYAGSGLRGYGKLLIIKHNDTFLSAYAHNEKLKVKEGDFVKGGQTIADMGSSGTDRVKLHFEIRRDGTPVDPLKYLPRR